jgi:hypothetical protein
MNMIKIKFYLSVSKTYDQDNKNLRILKPNHTLHSLFHIFHPPCRKFFRMITNCRKVAKIAKRLWKSQKDREKISGSFRNIRKVEKVVERLRKTQKVRKIADKG